jgi:hypothetical protein
LKLVLHLCVWSIVFTLFTVYGVQNRILEMGEERAYAAAIIGSHDAAVMSRIDQSSGWVVFDSLRANASFRASLSRQLKLNPDDLSPQAGSMWKEPIQIIGLYLLGDDKAPKDFNGNPMYPYQFTANAVYRGQAVQVKEIIYGPSVIGVIEYKHPVVVPTGKLTVNYKKAIFRYRSNNI